MGCFVKCLIMAAAFLPVGQLADIANAGTLYAFLMVAVAVMLLSVVLVLAVPASHGHLRLGAVTVAPAAAPPVPITRVWRYRQEWALVPVPPGRLTVQLRAHYQ